MDLNLSSALKKLAGKIELFDFLVLIYIAAIVRQYFWVIPNNSLAWVMTALVSVSLGFLYIFLKEKPDETRPASFWLIIGLPLLFFYALRVAYPDLSYDVLNYHIFHAERALRGILHVPGDFMPSSFPFWNSVPYMITGMFRHVLGYRLGTFFNYLALLSTGAILFKFLRPLIENQTLRACAVLLVLFNEQFLFEISTYLVDMLGLPFLLEATFQAMRDKREVSNPARALVYVALLLGISVSLKLPNIAFALPIMAVAFYRFYIKDRMPLLRFAKMLVAMGVAFFAPLAPHALYLFWTTGNPVFPLYNTIFHSPYWVIENIYDRRYGPKGGMEVLLWPIKAVFVPERLSELELYSGRLSLAFVAAILLILLRNGDTRSRTMGFLLIVTSIMWSAGSGLIRYGLFGEILSGLVLISLAIHLFRADLKNPVINYAAAGMVWCLMVTQSVISGRSALKTEWGARPTAIQTWARFKQEVPELLHDRSLKKYLTTKQSDLFEEIDVWVESGVKTSAFVGMLKPGVPNLNIYEDAYIATPAARESFAEALAFDRSKRMVALVFADSREKALSRLSKAGFSVVKITRLNVAYYSSSLILPMLAIQVEPGVTKPESGTPQIKAGP